ncbi:PDDEXK nuclease domain-containing protein [Extibacter muris]|uniref:DUF1016 family protein n=1 Tax=Extibacter muris TaxID=1796622 RepID=A0A4R4FBX8_9FIRM|nr:PDDEXK nuclease domain-containing protein [Extibacter muris]MCU0081534.1 PDDEXK nuclease domain-containing protein [Extibacter muris]TDA20076.1 DUF1016 family protein [Extibacter muris]
MDEIRLNVMLEDLILNIEETVKRAKENLAGAVNSTMTETYWLIGKYIVESEQNGNMKAAYGSKLLTTLSKELTLRLGKGYSRPNLNNMRKFYLRYPNYHAVSNKLSSIQTPEDVIKNTYTLEFLNIPELKQYSEGDLEQRIIDNLQIFLLELGKGFTFVGRQYKITVNNIHYHVDLVFYHRILKCFVLIDLKRNSVKHEDIGQMNMYLGYFAMEENMPDDNAPIGIILSKNKDELLVEYATYGMDSNLFVSKYELYLPNRYELEKLVYNILHEDIQNG